MKFEKSLAAWGTPSFPAIFKEEVIENGKELPLQKGLSNTSYALSEKLEAMLIGSEMEEDFLNVRAGIFFEGMLIGCSCADDPTPVEAQSEYCEMVFRIDVNTGETFVFV